MCYNNIQEGDDEMKYKGKKINKHRLRQLALTKSRDKMINQVVSGTAVHPEFYKYLKEEGYINDKGAIIRPIGELFGR